MTDATEAQWSNLVGNRCKVFCTHGILYCGIILNTTTAGIFLKDKYGQLVFINFTTIRQVEIMARLRT